MCSGCIVFDGDTVLNLQLGGTTLLLPFLETPSAETQDILADQSDKVGKLCTKCLLLQRALGSAQHFDGSKLNEASEHW